MMAEKLEVNIYQRLLRSSVVLSGINPSRTSRRFFGSSTRGPGGRGSAGATQLSGGPLDMSGRGWWLFCCPPPLTSDPQGQETPQQPCQGKES